MKSELTVQDQTRLTELESKIESARADTCAQFRIIGENLGEIRDSKLYRQTHKTFELYVVARWGFSRQRAYQLIEASTVAENVKFPLVIFQEGSARALARLEPKDQIKAVKNVSKKKQNPKPRDFIREAEIISPKTSKPRPRGGIFAGVLDAEEAREPEATAPASSGKTPRKIIETWWEANKRRLCEYPAASPSIVIQNILQLFP